MQHTVALKSYNNDVKHGGEGWVTRGQIFNVGKEHKPGLRTITEQRAKTCVQLGLHAEWKDGEAVPQPSMNDPHLQRRQALEARFRAGAPAPEKRVDERRKTKVDPPPQSKPGPAPQANPDPPPPRRAGGGRTSAASPPAPPAQSPSPAGGQTGATQSSASSSPADQAPNPSTGKQRGMRRGDPAHKKRTSASSASTNRGGSARAPTFSTAPTSSGGDQETDAPDSKD